MMVSGGFDPLHVGHVEYLERAALLGRVVVVLNSDAWLIRKKGYAFMPWVERCRVLKAMWSVYKVVPVDDSDGSVCEAIRRIKPDVFANGGDRTNENTPETTLCRELGIDLAFGLGGKVQTSSGLVTKAKTEKRAWGEYTVLFDGPELKVKMLTVNPKSATSVQRHRKRSEHWVYADNAYKFVPAGEVHQLRNESDTPLTVVEVQIGDCQEDDIERL